VNFIFQGVRRRMLDIGNTLGLSNTVMRMIDKRGSQVTKFRILLCLLFYGL